MADDSSVTSAIDRAVPYARFGLRIFPVHSDDKSPMPGYGWVELASSTINEVVEDFDRAAQLWGDDHVSVGWALGLDGYVAIDLDIPHTEWPQWAIDVSGYAAINITRRGQHLIFHTPEGLQPGNGDSGFPTTGWGEVRGYHGYIIIAGPDRPGLSLSEFDHCQVFPEPTWLREFGGSPEAITTADVIQFANAHSGVGTLPNKVNGIRQFCENWNEALAGDPRKGRHPSAVWALTQVADEALDGYYSFKTGYDIVRAWWKRVTPPERHGREWNGLVTWAVSKALMNHQRLETSDSVETEPHESLGDDGITSPYIDWPTFWLGGATDHDWLVEGFWPLGRSMLLHAPAKEGKSELVMWWAIQMATGIDLLTGEQLADPRTVLYVDYEMTDADVRDRLTDFGVDSSLDLSNLLYAMRTDDFTALDTALGGAACMERVMADHPSVIIFDTFSRCVDGDENEADTVRAFFRHTGRPIKQRGISYLRLDHTGKDHAKGARGSSAKNDDVDLIWSLRRNQTGQTLTSKSRVSWVPAVLHIDRLDGERIAYRRGGEISEMVPSTAETEKVYQLAEHDIDPSWSFRQVREALMAAGVAPGKNSTLMAAIKSYRAIRARGNVVKRPVDKAVDGDS